MTGHSSAIGALILVPIFIAASAAFVALKTSKYSSHLRQFMSNTWQNYYPWSRTHQTDRRRKLRRSNLPSSQLYGDSWCDLQSIDRRQNYSAFLNQNINHTCCGEQDHETAPGDTPRRVWHPSRSTRLNWSFTIPKSGNPNLFESSSVAKPSRVAQQQESLSLEDVEHLLLPVKAKGAHRGEKSGL